MNLEESKEQQVEEKNVPETQADSADVKQADASEPAAEIKVTFFNYITSLAFQAMIFLGEIPNPMADNKIDKNVQQAKLLIDTLLLVRDKTKGNLTKEEEDLLNASLYELELKYIEAVKSENSM